ncbi:hypothetical protein C8J56DRAFT_1104985 [Mycena floridula]|nr:hypothetical protein C8J56DRAFT_1104985 [Mycena floridula]
MESILELGEGAIHDVITIARDCQWLNKHTKLHNMLNQALSLSIPSNRSNRPLEEEEEDADFLHMTENDSVRDLALMDWARLRILDGCWMSPADQWYGYTAPGFARDQIGLVRTVHPVAWSIEEEAGERGQRDLQRPGQEDIHPRFSIVTGLVPPSHALCEQAFMAHRSDVIALRDEGIWFKGVNCIERRRKETRTREAKETMAKSQGSDSSTNSSTSTGPVLSTMTLQTTLSPPQSILRNSRHTSKPVAPRPITIAVAPVLDPPRLLPSIPHVRLW